MAKFHPKLLVGRTCGIKSNQQNINDMKYLITGAAGFIGFHLAEHFLRKGIQIVGLDNLNDYYDVGLKQNRLHILEKYPNFLFVNIDITDGQSVNNVFFKHSFDFVFHFAAQAGVRYSAVNPKVFARSNIVGFIHVLDCCNTYESKLLYASSSSVYGNGTPVPFSENSVKTSSNNLYAKSKIENENLVEIYSKHLNLDAIGVRLFSVYGPYGRPDMAYMSFANSIIHNESIKIYGKGQMQRDYTYIGDVIMSIDKLVEYYSTKNPKNEIYNIGASCPVSTLTLIDKLEMLLGKTVPKVFVDDHGEEMLITCADTTKLEKAIMYKPNTSIDDGLAIFIDWLKYYNVHQKNS